MSERRGTRYVHGVALAARALAASSLVGILAAPACSTDPDSGADCHEGDRVVCGCPGGTNGLASCDGGVYTPCFCPELAGAGGGGGLGSGGAATGGSPDGAGGSGGGMALLPFGARCTDDAECESMLCYAFGMGSKCTIPCPDDPVDCPNGGQGCNNMAPAVCKPP